MSGQTTVLVLREEDAARLVHWAVLFARARGAGVLALRPAAGSPGLEAAIVAAAERSRSLVPAPPPEVEVVGASGPDLAGAVLGLLRERECDLLLLGRPGDGSGPEAELFRRAPCPALLLRPGDDEEETAERVLVPLSGGPHAVAALEVAAGLAEASGGRVTALYVQTELGEDAEALGLRVLERAIPRSIPRERVTPKVVLAESVLAGITPEVPQHDLTLLGTSSPWFIHRILGRSIPDVVLAGPEGASVAVFRRAIPLPARVGRALLGRIESHVPRLGRSDRLALVERLQSSSRWDFDFVFLTALATLIAALGLVAGNVAVVIGAMLVAPLMTPLIGAGLALVQGNPHFLRRTLRTVAAGFLLALALGVLLGLVLRPGPTAEMAARHEPEWIDLAVAFAAGMAAAWAMGRPNLSAALPGVAIAASLVPPIATSGLAFATGEFRLAAGAALLFAANLVAIALGAAASLWLGGVRGVHLHRRQRAWVRRTAFALFVLAAGVVIALSFFLAHLARG